jgi:hypothetical protein
MPELTVTQLVTQARAITLSQGYLRWRLDVDFLIMVV